MVAVILALFVAAVSSFAAPRSARVVHRYPMAASHEVFPGTQIGVRSSVPLAGAEAVTYRVTASRTGVHIGHTHLSLDRCTSIFVPDNTFAIDETVSVTYDAVVSGDLHLRDSFQFSTYSRAVTPLTPAQLHAYLMEQPIDSARDLPAIPVNPLEPIMVTTVDNNPTPGTIYLNSFGAGPNTANFMLMLNEHGTLFWDRESPGAQDFTMQANGERTYFDALYDVDFGLDADMNVIDTFYAVNGLLTNGHELIVEPDGTYTLLGISTTPHDMSIEVQGGSSTANILGSVIQSFDRAHNLIFEWRGIDHYHIVDAVHENLTGQTVDFQHANSVMLDNDGNYVLSNRNLSEITKIEVESGNILWRLGGVNNQFAILNDDKGFSYQHDARLLPNADITLFDNGDFHDVQESRAVEYRLDESAMTATLVWQFHHDPPVYSSAMGSVERLPNGNTFIGWGLNGVTATETQPDNTTIFELIMTDGNYSYRALKDPAPSSGIAIHQADRSGLTLAPNGDGFELGFTSAQSGTATVWFMDAAGRAIVHAGHTTATIGPQHLHLEAPSLPSGVYYCVLQLPEGLRTATVSVVH